MIRFLRFLNRLLVVPVIVLIPFRRFFYRKIHNKKVLVIRLWGLGDSICALPMIKLLSNHGYKVYVLTTPSLRAVFTKNFIEGVICFNYKKPFSIFNLIKVINKKRFGIVIDTEQFLNVSTLLGLFAMPSVFIGYDHLLRSRIYNKKVKYIEMDHFVVNFARLLSPLNIFEVPDKLVPLEYPKSALKKVEFLLRKYKDKKLIGIHTGSGPTAKGRRWHYKNFEKLCNMLAKRNDVVLVFTGTEEEKKIFSKMKIHGAYINLINKLSLGEFVYLLKKLDVFVCNDTGPMHMAAAMGTKVVGLFGMNDPRKVGAWPLDKNINLYKNPNNLPIINNKYSRYPSSKYSTINLITPKEVYQEVIKILES